MTVQTSLIEKSRVTTSRVGFGLNWTKAPLELGAARLLHAFHREHQRVPSVAWFVRLQ